MTSHPIRISDLQLLHNFFCGSSDIVSVFDPENRITEQQDHKIKTDNSEADFNLSSNEKGISDRMKFYFGSEKWPEGKTFLYINNPDGTIRWIIPDDRSTTHLSLYNSGSFKANIYKWITAFLFKTGAGTIMSNGRLSVEQNLLTQVKERYNISEKEKFALFTGTRGNNRKIVLAVYDKKNITHFIKIPTTKQSEQLIENETTMIKELSKYDFTTLSIPRVTDSRVKAYSKLTNIKPAVTISAQRITELHLRTLSELYALNHERKAIADTAAWQTITNNMEWMKREHEISNGLDELKTRRVIHLLRKLFNSLNAGQAVAVSVSHGDFTPWNMYCDEHRLYVYDWELSSNGIPMLFDLFHFVFQSQILIHKQSYAEIYKTIQLTMSQDVVKQLLDKYKIDAPLHLKLYLLFTISYYIRLYIEEKELLMQSHWMVDVWLDGLEEFKSV